MKRFILAGIVILFILGFAAPCFAEGGFSIEIVAGPSYGSSSVNVAGQFSHVITDRERAAFDIEDKNLKGAVERYWGKKPNDAWVRKPGSGRDLYSKYGWNQVQTVVTIRRANILAISSETMILKKAPVKNNSDAPVTQSVSFSESVQESMANWWDKAGNIEVEQKINRSVAVRGGPTLNYSRYWGQYFPETRDTTVSATRNISLQPGEQVEARLTAEKCTMKLRVVYEASLNGIVATNYNPIYKGAHFWDLDVVQVMRGAGVPSVIRITEDIKVVYYADVSIRTDKDEDGRLTHRQ